MKQSSGPRKTANLSESVHRQLSLYALGATAAGVGVLALAHSAEAKIVYTATNVRLITGQNVYLDLNHDGTNDFYFVGQQSEKTSSGFAFLAISPEPGPKRNAVLTVQSNGNQCAAELPAGEQVGAGRPFKAKSLAMFFRSWGWTGGTSRCGWAKKPGPHYLGLMFRVKGTIHYGWARVKVASYPHYSATLTGYAYETIANKSIITGKTKGPDDASVEAPNASQIAPTDTPATLGMLALGAPTLSVWRREKLVGTND